MQVLYHKKIHKKNQLHSNCRFYEYHMSVKVSPTIVCDGYFSATTMESAFSSDLSLSHSMSHDEESPPGASRELFGVVDYNKSEFNNKRVGFDTNFGYKHINYPLIAIINFPFLAASLFRMFFYSLTELTFTEGLKMYLNEAFYNPLGVTELSHLYDAWQRAVDEHKEDNESMTTTEANYKVSELFDSWEHQEGYPILYVERSYNDHRVRFTQVR